MLQRVLAFGLLGALPVFVCGCPCCLLMAGQVRGADVAVFARALWNQAYLTLGEITLTAIVDRVLYDAAERFPPFESLKVEATGIDCRELRDKPEVWDDRDLAEGIRFVLIEFLIVIGNLTAEILTPALHAELSKVKLDDPARGNRRGEGKS